MKQPYNETQARSEYESFDREFLYQIAKERDLRGLSKSTKPELIDALVNHDKGQVQAEIPTDPANQIPPPPSLAQPDPDAPALPPRDPLFPDEELAAQTRRIRSNPTEKLQLKLQDPELPEHLRMLIQTELDNRALVEQQEEQRRERATKIARFKVVRGGRYVTRDGHITELPVGTLITDKTHDLEHVSSQGIVFQPATAVVVESNELGNQISRVL